MALDATACAAAIAAALSDFIQVPPVGDYQAEFAAAYDDYAGDGVVPGVIGGLEDPSLIEDAMRSLSSDPSSVGVMAAAFAAYWATAKLVPVPPNTAVVNDAATKTAAFAAAISASITAVPSVPEFKTFIENIEDVVKTIVWTITTPGGPVTSGIS